MSTPAAKLDKAENLIRSGFKQDGALLLRQVLRDSPESWRAWELLSEVTVGQARVLCIQKAAELKRSSNATEIPPQEDTILYEPTKSAKQITGRSVSTASAAAADKQSTHGSAKTISPIRYWATIGLAGLLLGCLVIFLINIFTPSFGNQSGAVAASSGSDAELIAAVFETATPSPEPTTIDTIDKVSQEDAELLPTNTPAADDRLIAKVIGEDGQARDAWTPTPTPTPTNTPTPTIEPTRLLDNSYTSFNLPPVGANERWVDVNLTLQTLTAFEGKTPVFQTIISSGRPPYFTVTGQFRVYYRLEEQTMDGRRLGFDYVTPGVPHVQYFYGDFAIHGAYWHDSFGTPVSHGCVNVTPADAEWLYNWMSYGTLVNVHY